MRIVSVCPSNTDLMAHLGALDWVVGRDGWSDWPEGAVDRIPVIGEVLAIDYEAVRGLEPDLILASRNVPGMEKVVPRLERLGFPMVVYDPETWDDVIQNLTDLGERIGLEARATEAIATAKARIAALQQRSRDLPVIDMVVEWWPEPVIVPYSETYVNEVLSWVRVRNPFEAVPGRSGRMDRASVLETQAQLYAISWCGTPWADYRTASVREHYGDVGAPFVEEPERVFKLWEGVIGHPSLRLLDGAQQILDTRLRLGL